MRRTRSAAHTFQGLGLKPLSPVHVRASRAGGDVTIGWIRRTRIGGDSWETPEVPLSEDFESYEVDVLDGADVVRTLTASAPSVVYTAAAQAADFGSRAARLRHPRLPDLGRLRPRHPPRRDGVNAASGTMCPRVPASAGMTEVSGLARAP